MMKSRKYIALWTVLLALSAGAQDPGETPGAGFLERAQSQEEGAVTITVAVPSAAEATELFGLPLYRRKIQPVWIEITNNRELPITFLPLGVDPQYFTPIESAFRGAGGASKANTAQMRFFLDRKVDLRINSGESSTGFIFTQLDEGTKAFNVDVFSADQQIINFTFFVPVPGLRLDHDNVDFGNLHADAELLDLERDDLIEALNNMPCCTTDKKSEGSGDPLNLVIIGTPADVYYAFIRAGWDETEVISRSSLTKMARSFLTGSEYRYSPVSGLYVFDRPQDVAFQKARDSINERNHLRLWMSPIRFQGIPVWIGQISRDIGVRFTRKTITTHKVDPDVDETREYLVENLAYSQALAKLGYVAGVGAAAPDEPRGNLTGDPYFTDGLRVVLWVSSSPNDLHDIEVLDLGAEPVR